jgi:hypothetical protein
MMKKVFAVSLLSLTTACASITAPSKQTVVVDTVPSGAEVRIDNQVQTSPAIFTLKGKSDYTVVAEKDGYKPTAGVINSEPRLLATIGGNILWLPVGVAIDFLTGSMFKLDTNVSIPLRPIDQKTTKGNS